MDKKTITILCMLGNFHAFVFVCCLFSKLTFSKNSFRNSIRVKQFGSGSGQILSVLILVQTAYKGYQQTTKVVTIKERVKSGPLILLSDCHVFKVCSIHIEPV